MVTEQSRDVVPRPMYLPFGQEYTHTGTDQNDTGHERDEATGLDYMMARYYSPETAFRFLSVDPAAESVIPSDPQSWNRYAYVRNRPIGRIDPDGTKDMRSDLDRARLEPRDVKAGAAESRAKAIETNEEYGTAIIKTAGEDRRTSGVQRLGKDGGKVQSDADPDKGETTEAQIHAHTEAATQEGPSAADWKAATEGENPVPVYVVTPDAVWRADPQQGDKGGAMYQKQGMPSGKKILWGAQYDKYIAEGSARKDP